MKEFIQRLGAETPRFFKKWMAIWMSIGASCTAALIGDELTKAELFPYWAHEAIKIGAFVGWICGVFMKLPIDWNKQDPKDVPNVKDKPFI